MNTQNKKKKKNNTNNPNYFDPKGLNYGVQKF